VTCGGLDGSVPLRLCLPPVCCVCWLYVAMLSHGGGRTLSLLGDVVLLQSRTDKAYSRTYALLRVRSRGGYRGEALLLRLGEIVALQPMGTSPMSRRTNPLARHALQLPANAFIKMGLHFQAV
jgi:hypothetical protein